jgi:hypothetical protein
MVDKKEKKRDVAVFANMMKDIMNESFDDPLVMLDRDIQHFIYGRVAVLVKHQEGKPIGSIADISTVVGAAFVEVLKEFTRGRIEEGDVETVVTTARENLVRGFDARAPKVKKTETTETSTTEGQVA